jgi:protein-tyrosine-phosphatase
MVRVLMVCTGNICRSPMAEGLLKHYLPADLKALVQVSSAGTHALHGNRAESHAIDAMAEIGIDIQHHRARQITRNIAREADLVLTMEASHISVVKRLRGWGQDRPRLISEFNSNTPTHDIEDPYGASMEAYETCIRTLRPCIKEVILHLGTTLQ